MFAHGCSGGRVGEEDEVGEEQVERDPSGGECERCRPALTKAIVITHIQHLYLLSRTAFLH